MGEEPELAQQPTPANMVIPAPAQSTQKVERLIRNQNRGTQNRGTGLTATTSYNHQVGLIVTNAPLFLTLL